MRPGINEGPFARWFACVCIANAAENFIRPAFFQVCNSSMCQPCAASAMLRARLVTLGAEIRAVTLIASLRESPSV